jgi:hypothetical protein
MFLPDNQISVVLTPYFLREHFATKDLWRWTFQEISRLLTPAGRVFIKHHRSLESYKEVRDEEKGRNVSVREGRLGSFERDESCFRLPDIGVYHQKVKWLERMKQEYGDGFSFLEIVGADSPTFIHAASRVGVETVVYLTSTPQAAHKTMKKIHDFCPDSELYLH